MRRPADKNHRTRVSFYAWVACLMLLAWPAISSAMLRVVVAPAQGNAKYPLVMSGLGHVLSTDLEQTGRFDIKDTDISTSGFSPDSLPSFKARLDADVILTLQFLEGTPSFSITLRAYDIETGYNLGSRQLRGTYSEVKFLQDRLLDASMELLRSNLSAQEKSDITRQHTDQVGAVQALGEARTALNRQDYVKAFEGYARSRAIDPKFRAPQLQLERRGQLWVNQLTDPEQAGQAYAFMGDTEKSMLRYNEALRRNASNVSALIGKADLLLQTRQPAQALSFYRQAADLDSKNAMAHVGLARAYEALGRGQEALVAYERARDLGATRPDVFESLGSLYSARKSSRSAFEAYQTAGELAERARHFSQAQSAYAKASKIQTSAQSLERQADIYLAIGEAEAASLLLRRALLLDPRRDALHSKLGLANYLSQQHGQATKNFLRAFELNQANFQANLYLGILFMEDRERRGQTIKHLENASRLRPDDPETHHHLAKAYLLENRFEAAIATLQKLTRTHPRDFRTHTELGNVYLVSGDFSGAAAAFSRAISIAPDDLAAREGMAKTYLHQGDRIAAIEAIRNVYAIDASNNFFVNAGDELLARIITPGLLMFCRRFPKMVPSEVGMSSINQVALAQLKPDRTIGWPIIKRYLLEPYEIDLERIQQDLELAFLAQYRVISHAELKRFNPHEITHSTFQSPGYLEPELAKDGLDGLFAFQTVDHESRDNSTDVVLNVALYSPISGEITEWDTRVAYLTEDILKLNPWMPILWGAIVFGLIFPPVFLMALRSKRRGKGSLQVIINYDPKLESFLTLKLSKKKEKEQGSGPLIVSDKEKYERKKYKQLLKQKGTWVRKMVGRVTNFERVPAREYYVYLYGTIEDTALTRKTIGNYYMFQRVMVEKDRRKELVFQVMKEEAFVTVFVRRGEDEVQGAEVRIPGDPDVKYVKPGTGGFIYLKQGKHNLRIQHQGETWIYPIEISDLSDRILNIDLNNLSNATESLEEETLTMPAAASSVSSTDYSDQTGMTYGEIDARGPSPAEEAAQITQADLDPEVRAQQLVRERKLAEAAQMYQDLGNVDKAKYLFGVHAYQEGQIEKALEHLEGSDHHVLLEKLYTHLGNVKKASESSAYVHLSKGRKVEAAQCFVKAELWAKGAEIFEQIGDHGKAAVLYAKDGDYAVAGELFAQAGDLKRAAMAFEKAGLLDQAVNLYRELNELDKVIELLIRQERFLDAASLNREQGLIDEAIALCQKVPSNHADRLRTEILLAKMFMEKGMRELAIKTFDEIYQSSAQDLSPDDLYAYATLLEQSEQLSHALSIFEDLLKRDFHHRDVAHKVEKLKQAINQAKYSPPSQTSHETIAAKHTPKESRYEILDEIGRGAMGVVYRAKDTKLDRIVAFKTLPQTLKDDEEALQSLMREAQTAAKLNHPNIVTVYDVGQENGNCFIAMEFLEGKTLQHVLKQVKRVNLSNFKAIAKPLCQVIGYAHSQRVIHRDVKPSNILLMPNRQVKLMDFGLAKVLQDLSIDKTMLRGTPLYMSPEQVLGKDIDHRTDIYSLGIIFYELLSGRPPFIEGDIMYAHLHHEPPPLDKWVKDLPDEWVASIMSTLAKEKAKRPGTAEELAQMLGL